MVIPEQFNYEGSNKEFQFRDEFVMPLLVQLGFSTVVNYHGQREFGRDVIFGDVDRFGHVVYHGMQIKYESSISLSGSHTLIQDAEEATHNPFRHPNTGREEYISCFYVANAGSISEPARDNFFNTIPRKGIRDARLLDGNALLMLDKSAALNRNSLIQERLTGLLQEIRVNRSLTQYIDTELKAYVVKPSSHPFPILRFRNTACASYLNAPFPIPKLSINDVDKYWQVIRVMNDVADSIGEPISVKNFKQHRSQAFSKTASDSLEFANRIESNVVAMLNEMGQLPLS